MNLRTANLLGRLLCGLFFIVPSTSWAVDGVIEISHTGALAGGVLPSDSPGYPVTIAVSGSYRLTSDLAQPNANVTVIEVTADDVTIDLNGFALTGENSCTKTVSVSCDGNGTGDGIDASARLRTRVLNGFVRGMGGAGVILGDNSQAADVHATSNGGTGIEVGNGSVVTRVVARLNDWTGVTSDEGSVVSDSTASQNRGYGIFVIGSISRCTAIDNDNDGFYLYETAGSDLTSIDNDRSGFFANHASILTGCVARGNDSWGYQTIQASASSVKPGISASGSYGNGSGHFSGSWLNLGTNVCNGSTASCP